MSEAQTIGPGSRVVLEYTITLNNGTVADTTRNDAPLEFTIGDGTLVSGLEQLLYGLGVGDSHSLQVTPEQAFGYPDPTNHQKIPLADFGPELTVEEGVIIGFTLPNGDEVPGTVMHVGAEHVDIDFNHPLAGQHLTLEVEVVSVQAAH